MKKKRWDKESDWNEALLVAHLLGGRYGFNKEMEIPAGAPPKEQASVIRDRVALAIKVAKEIQKQLGRKES